MASFKHIFIVKDGTLKRVEIRKPQAPRGNRILLLGHIAANLIGLYKARYFAMRLGGKWGVYPTNHPAPLREFEHEAQASMWLLAWEARRGRD